MMITIFLSCVSSYVYHLQQVSFYALTKDWDTFGFTQNRSPPGYQSMEVEKEVMKENGKEIEDGKT